MKIFSQLYLGALLAPLSGEVQGLYLRKAGVAVAPPAPPPPVAVDPDLAADGGGASTQIGLEQYCSEMEQYRIGVPQGEQAITGRPNDVDEVGRVVFFGTPGVQQKKFLDQFSNRSAVEGGVMVNFVAIEGGVSKDGPMPMNLLGKHLAGQVVRKPTNSDWKALHMLKTNDPEIDMGLPFLPWIFYINSPDIGEMSGFVSPFLLSTVYDRPAKKSAPRPANPRPASPVPHPASMRGMTRSEREQRRRYYAIPDVPGTGKMAGSEEWDAWRRSFN